MREETVKRENDDAFSIFSPFPIRYEKKKEKKKVRETLLTFLPSNSWGPFVSTLSTLEGSANVTNPKPLSTWKRGREERVKHER